MATVDGLVAVDIPLNVDSVVEAYSKGIFPWPHEDMPMLWFCPPKRGVLFFKDLHISKSLQKKIRQNFERKVWQVTFNQAFSSVIEECQKQPRPGQNGTWITEEIKQVYQSLFDYGIAQSVEIWSENELVGGIYGVEIKGVFSGESMFFKDSDASKIALIELVKKLSLKGQLFMDTQMVTPVLANLGAKEIERREFLKLLALSQK
jgi:leucyl/phenylalanyl-tRNA---protein transferase